METLWNRGHASEAMRAPGSIGWNGMPMEVRESYGREIIRAPVRVGVDGVQAVPGVHIRTALFLPCVCWSVTIVRIYSHSYYY